jgi:trehalose utilization protein
MAVDATNPLAHGIGETVDVFFDNNPVFAMSATVPAGQAKAVGWFASGTPLRSGWAWGQEYLNKGIGIVDAKVGQGRVFLFGPEILFRSQPHGTYKFFFNGIYLSVAPDVK